MQKVIYLLTCVVVFRSLLFGASENSEKSITFGATGGISSSHGSYESQLSDGYNVALFLNYHFFDNRFILLESDLSLTEHTLKNSKSSKLTFYSFGLGPVLNFPVYRYLRPYIGLLANINYFNLTAATTKRNERTFKAGVMGKAGLHIPVYSNILTNIGIRYTVNELSGKTFRDMSYFAGVSYSYDFIPREKAERSTRIVEADELYESGLKYLKIGDGIKAKGNFNKVITLNKNYKDVQSYMEIIKTNEDNLNKSAVYLSENRPFDALPLLVTAEKYLLEAKTKLYELRLRLAKEADILVKLGIDAYNKEDYESCIYLMQRAELVLPDNESIKIYLPRAQQRFNAMQKLK